ncbi:MAG TPA: tetratricopeptide repeat protein [Candidatus Omnitrophota bacterium]|nr:tetratricopeptide repeat protein [Candidatus Omnitrophota bacterium]
MRTGEGRVFAADNPGGRLRTIGISLGLCLIFGFLIYSNSFTAGYHFDDEQAIVGNTAFPAMQGKPLLKQLNLVWNFSNSRFVSYLSFALNYRLGGLGLFGYHLTNLLIHVSCSVLLCWLVLLTFQAPRMRAFPAVRYAGAVAVFSSLIFLVHPVQTQSVTYITQRMAALATFFYLGAMIFYVKFRFEKKIRFLVVSWLSALAAVFTKEISYTLPVTLFVYEWLFFERKKLREWILPFLPYLLLALFSIFISFRGHFVVTEQNFVAKGFEGLSRFQAETPRVHYLLTQIDVLRTYLRLFVFPIRQNLDYDYPIARSLFAPSTFASFVFLAGLCVWAFLNRRRYPILAYGIFWFFIVLSIESGVIVVKDVIFEHRMYLAMVGLSMFFTAGLALLFRDEKEYVTILAVVVMVFSGLTYVRNNVWKDEVTLWGDAVRKSPAKARPNNNYGKALADFDRYEEAIPYLEKAIEIQPDQAEYYDNLGLAYKYVGNSDKAIELYKEAIEKDPKGLDPYRHLTAIYLAKEDFPRAEAYLKEAIELDPRSSDLYYYLGSLYEKQNRPDEAIEAYGKSLELRPDQLDVCQNLGALYLRTGRVKEAEALSLKAAELSPQDAVGYYNLAHLFSVQKRYDKAIELYQIAVRLDPVFVEAYNSLGCAYDETGEYDKAIENYRTVLRIQPDHVGANNNLGITYLKKGDKDLALKQVEALKGIKQDALADRLKQRIDNFGRPRSGTRRVVTKYTPEGQVKSVEVFEGGKRVSIETPPVSQGTV